MRYEDIDWGALWREAHQGRSSRKKSSVDWDRRAASFARRTADSPYASLFLSRLHLEPGWSVLDMGCGPGTLAVPLAARVRQVTAADYSPAMLDVLQKRAEAAGCTNITALPLSWDDDWQACGLLPHEVAIASRSLAVDDLSAALAKLDRYATRAVYLADRVGTGPADPLLLAAVGRDFKPGPDYIYTINILYRMGICAHVDFIDLPGDEVYFSKEDARDACRSMLGEMNPEEEAMLECHLDERLKPAANGTGLRLERPHCPRWALIWWLKEESRCGS